MNSLPQPDGDRDRQPSPPPEPRRRSRWAWLLLALGLGAAGSLAALDLLLSRLVPSTVEAILTDTLERPIDLGDLTGWGLSRVRFGETSLPATASDPDFASIRAIEARFSLWQLVTQRRLVLDITLISPEAYLEQDQSGKLVELPTFPQRDREGPVKVAAVRLEAARATLRLRQLDGNLGKPIVLAETSGRVELGDRYHSVTADLSGQLAEGNFSLRGAAQFPDFNLEQLTGQWAVTANRIELAGLSALLPPLPLHLQSGRVGGNVQLELEGNVLNWRDNTPRLTGTLQVEDLQAVVNKVPQPVRVQRGRIRFQGDRAQLEGLQAEVGAIAARLDGQASIASGYDLELQVAPVSLDDLATTFELEPPLPLSGAVAVEADITGDVEEPILTGRLRNACPTNANRLRGPNADTCPLRLDRLDFDTVAADFQLHLSAQEFTLERFLAQPRLGGAIAVQGKLHWPKPLAELDVQVLGLPSAALAERYDLALPADLGDIAARAQVAIALSEPGTWQARATSNLQVGDAQATLAPFLASNQQFAGRLRFSGLTAAGLGLTAPLALDDLEGDLAIAGSPQPPFTQGLSLAGRLQLSAAGGSLSIENLRLADQRLTARVTAADLDASKLVPTNLNLPHLPPLGRLGGALQVSSQLAGFRPEQVQATGDLGLAIAGGRASVTQASFNRDGSIAAEATLAGLQLAELANLAPLPASLQLQTQALGRFSGQIQLATRWTELRNLDAIALQGCGRVADLASGSLATQFSARAGSWQSEARFADLQPSRLLPQLPPRWQTVASGRLQLAGSLSDLSLTGLRASGAADLGLAGGRVAARELRLANGKLSARLQPEGLQLAALAPQLRGQLSGAIAARADLRQPGIDSLQADGRVRLSDSLTALRQPLTAEFAWNGRRLAIARASAGPQLQARGYADLALAHLGRRPALDLVQQFNFDARVQGLELATLRADLARFTTLPPGADALAIAGSADFSGQLAGTPRSPRLAGQLALNNVALNELRLDPRLAGPVAFAPGTGARADLRGSQDRLQLALDSAYRPLSLNLRLDEASVSGERSGANSFAAEARELPLALVRPLLPAKLLTPTLRAQPLAGRLNGNFDLDLTTFGLAGTVAIAQPQVGPLRGDRFTGGLEYREGAIAVRDGRWQDGATDYQLTARLVPLGPQPEFHADVAIANGQVQDLLAMLKLADFPDIRTLLQDFRQPATGSAADLDTIAIGLPDESLETQLRFLAEIRALQEQTEQERRDTIPLPELSAARGSFNGSVTLGGPLNQGLNAIEARFDLAGNDWQWGSYFADSMLAKGDFQNGVLTILPLRFRTGEGEIALGGSFGAESISGQLEVSNLPIATLQDIIPLPPFIGFSGQVNASVNLAGTQANPQARGTIEIANAELNDTPVSTAEGSFNYNNAVLRFAANSTLETGGTPLTLRGNIPYRLPLPQAQPPESYDFAIAAKAENDGLAILNFFTNRYLIWQGGQGNADIEVSGKLDPERRDFNSLIASGIINIEQATLGSQVVPDSISDVKGKILLNFDRIEVPELTGNFGGGSVRLSGVLPTQEADLFNEQPLTLQLNRLALRLKGIMEGEVEGQVLVQGTALDPELTGTIDVTNGDLQLLGAAGLRNRNRLGNSLFQEWVEFNNLQLVLGRNFFITWPGILSFATDGTLTLAGTFAEPKPQGDIRLERGYINLFTSQLRLDRGEKNLARFSPRYGFDPLLNLYLSGTVTDVTNRAIPTSAGANSSEIVDNPRYLGSVETVRVRARVEALASELQATLNAQAAGIPSRRQSVLQLSSTPSRSETEIIALLGGSFINAIAGNDDVALVGGIANLAGNALLGRFQNNIADALGLDEFRIFPAEVLDDEDRRGDSQLGIAIEVSKDLSNNFSLSVQQYLTPPEQPTRFSARYRVNENLILRGSTDLEGDSRATVEFQTRF